MDRPRLILVSGPPGCGKSTFSEALARRVGALLLDKDAIDEPFSPNNRGEVYSREVEPKVLQSLLNLAELNLKLQQAAILDVPWTHILLNNPEWVIQIRDLSSRLRVPLIVFECHVSEKELKMRLMKRRLPRDFEKLTEEGWRQFALRDRIFERIPLPHCLIDVEQPIERSLRRALDYLQSKAF